MVKMTYETYTKLRGRITDTIDPDTTCATDAAYNGGIKKALLVLDNFYREVG